MSRKPLILIVEDEAHIRDMIKFALQHANFVTVDAENTKQAEYQIADQVPDLVLLDWMLPDVSGIEFTKRLKRNPNMRDVPIIMLTAKAEEDSKVKGLDAGADDYITKPFSPRELIARIKTVLRRGLLINPEGLLQFNNLSLNTHNHQVMCGEKILKLSPIEFELLHFFMTHPERTYSREQILNHVWGGNTYIDERTVDVHIRRLRKLLAPCGCDKFIHTIRNAGYQFTVTL